MNRISYVNSGIMSVSPMAGDRLYLRAVRRGGGHCVGVLVLKLAGVSAEDEKLQKFFYGAGRFKRGR